MRRSPATSLAMLIALALAAAWAFNTLIGKRFATGEMYKPGSSLRADPMGTKALHDSLNRLSGVRAERNYRTLKRVTGSQDKTLLCVMVTPEMFADGADIDGESLVRFAEEGGRVVITLSGQVTNWNVVATAADKRRDENRKRREEEKRKKRGERPPPANDQEKKGEDKEKKKSGDEDEEKHLPEDIKDPDPDVVEAAFLPPKSLQEMLGVKVNQENFVMTPDGALQLETPLGLGVEKGSFPGWYTRTSLEIPAGEKPKWKPLGLLGEKIMLASRETGKGIIIIATDTYFMTNEALYKEPATKFLSWLMGSATTVIFEETHLGTQENPGIMTLARRHRLHGMFLGGLLLFALFVWKSSMSLVPARDDDAPSRTVAGRGATAGLVSLLRRGIPLTQVLRRGLDAWEQGALHRPLAMQARIARARQHLPPENAHAVRGGGLRTIYRLMCDMLHPSRSGAPAPQATPSAPPSTTLPDQLLKPGTAPASNR